MEAPIKDHNEPEFQEKALIRFILKANQKKKQRLLYSIIGEILGLFKMT